MVSLFLNASTSLGLSTCTLMASSSGHSMMPREQPLDIYEPPSRPSRVLKYQDARVDYRNSDCVFSQSTSFLRIAVSVLACCAPWVALAANSHLLSREEMLLTVGATIATFLGMASEVFLAERQMRYGTSKSADEFQVVEAEIASLHQEIWDPESGNPSESGQAAYSAKRNKLASKIKELKRIRLKDPCLRWKWSPLGLIVFPFRFGMGIKFPHDLMGSVIKSHEEFVENLPADLSTTEPIYNGSDQAVSAVDTLDVLE